MNLERLLCPATPKQKPLAQVLAKSTGETLLSHSRSVANWGKELEEYLKTNQPNIAEQLPSLAAPCGLHDLGKATESFEAQLTGTFGQTFYHEQLSEAWCIDANISLKICQAIGAHHTRLVDMKAGQTHNTALQALKTYSEAQKELAETIFREYGVPAKFDGNPWLLCGAIIFCDWLGSGDISSENARTLLQFLLKPLGTLELSFDKIFSFPPNELQIKAQKATAPITILSATMGRGKTEAALIMAYNHIRMKTTSGIYFALPSRLTSNMIYKRVNTFLDKIDPDSTARLIHSGAWLVAGKRKLSIPRLTKGNTLDFPTWLLGGKGALLGRVGIGTIDQILMMVLRTKAFPLRYFGLCNKTIIIDEVHSYDLYTGTLLVEMLKELLVLKCKVILLSATLTKELKDKLSNLDKNSLLIEDPNPGSKSINMHILGENECKQEAISRSKSETVLWVVNTVQAAQDAYEYFWSEGIETGLLHSRFTPKDRNKNEEKWMAALGKTGVRTGRILVATQVVEQSVDIDADVLFTELCPIDLLFQRMGRLHRHTFCRKNGPETFIIEPEDKETFGKSGYIYAPWILYKSLQAVKDKRTLNIPEDMSACLEQVYDEANYTIQEVQSREYTKFKKEKDKLEAAAKMQLDRYLNSTQSDEETLAKTRMFGQPQKEVLLIKSKELGKWTLVDGSQIDMRQPELHVEDFRKIYNNCVPIHYKDTMKESTHDLLTSFHICEGNMVGIEVQIDGDEREFTYDDKGLYEYKHKKDA